MKVLETKLTAIGNSRGIRLPAEMIRRYHLEEGVLLEAHEEEIILKPKASLKKLSWEETARQMAAEDEDWREWDTAAADGLETCPWDYPLPPDAVHWAKRQDQRTTRSKTRRA